MTKVNSKEFYSIYTDFVKRHGEYKEVSDNTFKTLSFSDGSCWYENNTDGVIEFWNSEYSTSRKFNSVA